MNSMENTTENKYKFFALHWGQEVHRVKMSHSNPLCKVGYYLYDNNIENDHLELTPLSQITDEDAIQVIKISGTHYGLKEVIITHHKDDYFGRKWTRISRNYNIDAEVKNEIIFNTSNDGLITHSGNGMYHDIFIKITDYLRSKGYALPFMGLSVEDLISYGWVKLKQI